MFGDNEINRLYSNYSICLCSILFYPFQRGNWSKTKIRVKYMWVSVFAYVCLWFNYQFNPTQTPISNARRKAPLLWPLINSKSHANLVRISLIWSFSCKYMCKSTLHTFGFLWTPFTTLFRETLRAHRVCFARRVIHTAIAMSHSNGPSIHIAYIYFVALVPHLNQRLLQRWQCPNMPYRPSNMH